MPAKRNGYSLGVAKVSHETTKITFGPSLSFVKMKRGLISKRPTARNYSVGGGLKAKQVPSDVPCYFCFYF